MAGKSTISVSFKLDGDSKGFKELANSAEGFKGVIEATITESEKLKKSLVNWSQGIQAIGAITNTINAVSSAFTSLTDKMKGLQQDNLLTTQLTGKTGEEMQQLRNSVKATAEHFGTDFGDTMQAVNALAKGFGITAEEAMGLIKDGFVSGANANGEFVDTLKEYPRYFKEAGLSAEEFIAITTNAANQGVYSDKGVDVIKEGNLRIREMTKATADALNGIGISAEQVQTDLQNGSITTFDVMQMVATKLNELPASSAAVGTAIADIFGEPGEDAGLEYIKTLSTVQLNMDAVKAAAGSTAEQQERLVNTQENLKNSLSGLIDLSAIYTNIQPYVDLAAQVGTTLMGVGAFIKTIKEMNIAQALAATRTIALTAAQKAATIATAAWAGVQKLLNFVLSANPIGLVVMAIGALVYAVVEAYKNCDGFRKIVDKVWEGIKPLANAIMNGLAKAFEWLVEKCKEAWEWLKNILGLGGKKVEVAVNVSKPKSTPKLDLGDYTYKPSIAPGKTPKAPNAAKVNPVWKEDASTLKEITDNIQILQNKLQTATIEEAALINQQIKSWRAKADAIENAGNAVGDGCVPVFKEEAATLQDISNNIQILQNKLQTATIEEAALINQQIEKWREKEDAIKNAGKAISKTPEWNANANTLKEISGNIQILNDQLQTATIEEAALINQQIKAWNDKADAIRNAGKAAEVTAVNTGKALKDGWGGIKNIGSSIEGITNSLRGNGNAWQIVCGIVDGFIGLYEGIQMVIGIISLLTGASAAHAATKSVEAGAETTAAGARTAAATNTIATTATTIAANKLAAASFKELAAAEYMAAHAYIPFAGFGIALGFTSAMLAAVTAAGSIPMLANGGVASGPTLALVGEYAGASGNPEVIAPLDKLRGMLADPNDGTDFGKVKFEIKGRTLVGILAKENNITNRS